MYVLRNAYELFDRFISTKSIEIDTYSSDFRWSVYVINDIIGGYELRFNSLTGELIAFEIDMDEDIDSYLVAHWFKVPVDFDEYSLANEAKKWYREAERIMDGVNVYTIFTTTDCNARCFYCYEKNSQKQKMTLETADRCIEHMDSSRGDKELVLTWYGGEPLYNIEVIDYITDRLKKRGVKFISECITNAYLFNEINVKKAVESWNLTIARVTLDGVNDEYKKIKNYIYNDNDPLETVIGNIKKLVENGIHVQIRLHIGFYNIDDVGKIVDRVIEEFAGNPLVDSYLHTIYENHEYSITNYDEESRLRLVKRLLEYERRLLDNGLLNYKLKRDGHVFACRADSDDVRTILPNGDIIRCRDFLKDKALGNVFTGETDADYLKKWEIRAADFEKCKTCAIYPECARLALCKENAVCHEVRVYKRLSEIKYAMKIEFEKYISVR